MAFVGDNITSAQYVPYVAYQGNILYDGLNSSNILVHNMEKSANDIWNVYGDFSLIEANLIDSSGNHLTLHSTSVVGNNVQIFDDMNKMKAWLLS